MKALIIDDEQDICDLISMSFQSMDIECDTAKNVSEAISLLNKNKYKFCLTDLNLPDGTGIDIVQFTQSKYPNMPIAVITAYGDMNTAVTAMKAGAFDFIAKPIELAILRQTAKNALEQNSDKGAKLNKTNSDITRVNLLGESQVIKLLKKQITKVAKSLAPICIFGESGTGKELVAKMIHQQSSRKNHPFIPINCGALPENLIESELFGHKKGSFTGAVTDQKGLFKQADGGTLFLDEIAELPILMQVKLLRALQEKKIRPVGATTEQAIDVRVISASHKNLDKCVADGTFRQDLFYRLNVIELNVPPLRERQDDIELLVNYFINKIADDLHVVTPNISPKAQKKLNNYDFEGNVRELENIIQRAITLCEDDTIKVRDLFLKKINKSEQITKSLPQVNNGIEIEMIKQALKKHKWNKKAAAKELGISYRQMRYKVDKLKL